jgi:hypothetical protein
VWLKNTSAVVGSSWIGFAYRLRKRRYLLLARSAARTREFAVRSALGAIAHA